MSHDPLVVAIEYELEDVTRKGLRWDIPRIARRLAKVARAQKDLQLPDLTPKPPPVEECPRACPVGQLLQAQLEHAERKLGRR